MARKLAVIGAGVSACFFSYLQRKEAQKISLFEKSRGIGGRCSVRRHKDFGSFNLGAQFFTNKNPELKNHFKEISDCALIKKISGSVGYFGESGEGIQAKEHERYIGNPSMNSFLKFWSMGVDIKLSTHVSELNKSGDLWQIKTKDGQCFDGFDTCVLSIPSPQGICFWQQHSKIPFPETKMYPCLALMLITDDMPIEWHNAFMKDPVLSWYASQSCEHGLKWTVHANARWSAQHLGADAEWIQSEILSQLFKRLGHHPKLRYAQLHRWRYASSESSADRNFLWDSDSRLAYIGDWLAGGRVEGAMESAAALAAHLPSDFL
ncbi:MAG: NAD(P)-binding protein [Oligoflexales bacterium]|nr:NAD(P)-binding protein [Oligoflexales bacterium]